MNLNQRALLVGINNYPSAPLRGCVNDVNDLAKFLSKHGGFKSNEIRRLTNSKATTSAILESLRWLVKGAAPGDRLYFHYSGHGVQLPTLDPDGEPDGLDEAICPVDFDWTDKRVIRDKDFARIFRSVPAGTHFVWISDSCHSGDLSRRLPLPARAQTRNASLLESLVPAIRWIGPATNLAWRLSAARKAGLPLATLADATKDLNLVLITACKANQTAHDAIFKRRANGALTYILLKTLEAKGGLQLTLQKLLPKIRAALKEAHFRQQPQLEGSKSLFRSTFLGKE